MDIDLCRYCGKAIVYDDTVDLWSSSDFWLNAVCEESPKNPKEHKPRLGSFGGNHS